LSQSRNASQQSSGGPSAATAPQGTREDAFSAMPPGERRSPADDIQFLLEQAESAIASVNNPTPTPPNLSPFPLNDLGSEPASQEKATLDLLGDVELDLKIELGRTHMYLEDVLKLRRGSVVTLDKLAGDPVDVYVNGRLIARGEVLVLNDNFCVRVAELVAGDDTK
jgi:flagellar motor switch protein FliN/FliY